MILNGTKKFGHTTNSAKNIVPKFMKLLSSTQQNNTTSESLMSIFERRSPIFSYITTIEWPGPWLQTYQGRVCVFGEEEP